MVENFKTKGCCPGWNVGLAAYYISQEGAQIVGIIDKDGGLINEDGFHLKNKKTLFNQKRKFTLWL